MYRICETVRANHGPDGAVLLDIKRGRVLRLNLTGSLIFQGLQHGDPATTIIDGLVQEFLISREIANADFNEFVSSMARKGLIEVGEFRFTNEFAIGNEKKLRDEL